MSDDQSWTVIEPPDIRKIFRRLGHAQRQKYIQLFQDFQASGDPRKLGRFKKGLDCYVAELDSSFRVSYNVLYEQRIIEILDIDDHKGIYGSD